MCNLYSLRAGSAAVREMLGGLRERVGNLPPLPAVFPDAAAPVVRVHADGERELVMARWGMPSPAFALEGRKVDRGVTNIRNAASPHWRRWLAPASRCLVPFTSFSEPGRDADGRSEPVWFALGEDRPPAFFAGVWTNWTCTRKVAEGEINCDLFGFLTTDANAEVGAVHPKAMPVILTEPADWEAWLTEPWPRAATLQRPLPDGKLRIVARGAKSDGAVDP